jgi:hypothetical protein
MRRASACYTRRDVRSETSTCISGQLCEPSHPTQQMPAQDVVCAVEMCGGSRARQHSGPDTDERQDERHGYEKCQYEEFMERVAKMDKIRADKAAASTN